jgi:exodeoxyribonuclease-5
MNLTPSQNNAVELFFQFLSDTTEHNFILRGGSGKGKTFTVAHLIKKMYKFFEMNRLLDDSYQEPTVYITTTTNQAAERLYEATGAFTQTIHSLLSLTVKNDNLTGKTYLHRRASSFQKLTHCVLFIDEASMIDDELEEFINNSIDPNTTKVVRIGDPDQILAVDAEQPVGLQVQTPYTVDLVEYCRADALSPITLLGEQFRQAIYTGVIPDIQSSNEIIIVDGKGTKEAIDSHYLSASQHVNHCKTITYTNSRTQEYNQFIRSKFINVDILQPNEIVSTNGTVVNQRDNKVQFRNNSYLQILSCDLVQDTLFNEKFEILKIAASEVGDLNYENVQTIYAFRYPQQLAYILSKLYKSGNYRDYFEVKNRYADLRQTYAMTSDKSQGSTFDHVIIDLNDMRKNKNISHLMRRMYVAITRAKYKVFLRGSLKG